MVKLSIESRSRLADAMTIRMNAKWTVRGESTMGTVVQVLREKLELRLPAGVGD